MLTATHCGGPLLPVCFYSYWQMHDVASSACSLKKNSIHTDMCASTGESDLDLTKLIIFYCTLYVSDLVSNEVSEWR